MAKPRQKPHALKKVEVPYVFSNQLWPGIRYCLAMDQAELNAALDAEKMICEGGPPAYNLGRASGASVHSFERNDGGRFCVVAIAGADQHNIAEIAAMAVHEAVHIYQYIMDDLGEQRASTELEAYIIQAVTVNILTEFFEKTGRIPAKLLPKK